MAAQQHGPKRSKSPKYADLPDWAKPDSGHKPPSPAANKKIEAHRNAAKGGAANASVGAAPAASPAPAAKPPAPINRTTYIRSPRDLSYKPGAVSSPVGGSAQVVLVLVVLLLLMAEWKQIVVPFSQMVWSGKSSSTINWKSGLGLGIFALVLVFLASVNDDMAGLMMIVVMGMLAVYMVEQKGGAFTSFFTWLQAPATTGKTSSTGTTSPPPVKTGANPTGAA